MFIYDFIQLDFPFQTVREHVERGSTWLAPLAAGAYVDGQELRVRVGPTDAPKIFAKEVRVTLGSSRKRGDGVVVPLRLEATGPASLFPVLDADLEIAPRGPSITQVALWGLCDPPCGAVGRSIDRLVLHRLAEATIRSFLTRVAAALQDGSGPHVCAAGLADHVVAS